MYRPIRCLWADLPPINSQAQRTPRLSHSKAACALLERIVQASSNEGDVDARSRSCGCGTAVAAAQKLNRRWVGIDVTRPVDLAHEIPHEGYVRVEGEAGLSGHRRAGGCSVRKTVGKGRPLPIPVVGAVACPGANRWAATPTVEQGKKKASDKGIDGVINFINEKEQDRTRADPGQERSRQKRRCPRPARCARTGEEAALGVFITLEDPSKDMVTEFCQRVL